MNLIQVEMSKVLCLPNGTWQSDYISVLHIRSLGMADYQSTLEGIIRKSISTLGNSSTKLS